MKHRFREMITVLAGLACAGISLASTMTPAQAAPPADYYQIGVSTMVGSTIGAADDGGSGGSACTLRDAVNIAMAGTTNGQANGCTVLKVGSGGPYVIRLPKGAYTYTLSRGEISITNTNLSIIGTKAASSIIQAAATPGTATHRLFNVSLGPDNTVVFENVTLRNGRCTTACLITNNDAGALLQNGGTVTLQASVVANNITGDGLNNGAGGAIEINSGMLNITGKSVLSNNSSNGIGGAIFQDDGTLVQIDGSTLIDNTAVDGGGVYLNGATAELRVIHGSVITRSKANITPSASDIGGGIFIFNSKVTVDGSSLTNLDAEINGGAVVIGGTGSLTLQAKSVVANNRTDGSFGGGIYMSDPDNTLIVDASAVKNNISTRSGGGIFGVGQVTVQNHSSISGNMSESGGGIFNDGGTLLVTGRSQVSNNQASDAGSGGGIYSAPGATTVINGGSLVSGNKALDGTGGGLFGEGIELDGMTLSKNFASNGGGVDGQFSAIDSLISGNISSGAGGGFIAEGAGQTTIISSTISGNKTLDGTGAGGRANESLTVTNSTFNGNKSPAGADGGGLDVENGAVTRIANSTFTGNFGASGGINVNAGALSLYNVTISGNKSANSGGGLSAEIGAVVSYQNTIISGNSGPAGKEDCDTVAAGASAGHNLVGTTCDASGAGDLSGAAPKLGKPANNGGPTNTMALMSGSPAIDGGDPTGCKADLGGGLASITTDQRGFLRSFGAGCDIGAFEAQPKPAALAAPNDDGTTQALKFSWKPAPGAAHQTLVVDANPGCASNEIKQELSGTAKSFGAPANTLSYGFHFWCILATLPDGTPITTSDNREFEYTFVKAPPDQAYLKQGQISFSWLRPLDPNSAQPATSFDLLVSTSRTCATADVVSMPGLATSSTVATLAPGTYYWQVTAHFPVSASTRSTCRSLRITY